MAGDGPNSWTPRPIVGPRFLMGRELLECPMSVQISPPGAGISIPMLAGGSVYQRNPAHLAAPIDLEERSFSIEFQADSESSWDLWQEAEAVAHVEPIQFWFVWPQPDIWLIRDASTVWTLSRTLPFGLVSAATFPPRAWLRDIQGPNATELTLITSGTPGAGELKYDAAANSITVETADLSAHIGRMLVLRYCPLRLFHVESLDQDYSSTNDLKYTVELGEVVPHRSYGA